jgi:CIC family chloride channel protein
MAEHIELLSSVIICWLPKIRSKDSAVKAQILNFVNQTNLTVDKTDKSSRLDLPFIEAFVVGVVSGLSALMLKYGVEWLGTFRVAYSSEYPTRIVLPLVGLVGGLLAGILVDRIAPEAAGSGIPQVKAALNRIRMTLDLRIAVTKLVGGMLALGSGLFMGREGPTVQLGAALAASLSRRSKQAVQFRRQLIAAGAGAGLAAAFNAPIAGVVFVLEELLKDVSSSTVILTLSACGGAALVLNLASHYRHIPEASLSIVPTLHLVDIPFVAILGVVCAVMGCIFNQSIVGALNVYQQLKHVPIFLRVALAGLLTGLVVSSLPVDFRNYANMRELIVSGQTSWQMVLVAFFEFFLLTLIAYGSGAPGGLFAPCLVLGATLGYMVGLLEVQLTGHGSPTTLALVGMGAFFAGVGRVPLTAITITFELTASFALVTPLIIACSIASFMGEKILPDSLYERLMVWNGINLRYQSDEPVETRRTLDLKAVNVMKYVPDQTVESKTSIADAIRLFRASTSRGLPVVDKGKLVGIISQRDLGDLLHLEDPPADMKVKDVMTLHPVAVNPYDSLEEILFLFTRYKFSWLPVAEEDRFIGIISQGDVTAALFDPEPAPTSKPKGTESGEENKSEQSKKEGAARTFETEQTLKMEPFDPVNQTISAEARTETAIVAQQPFTADHVSPAEVDSSADFIKETNKGTS